MAPAKDQPMAFMPSANDSLSNGNHDFDPSLASYIRRQSESHSLLHETAVLSPVSEQQNSDMASIGSKRKASGELPMRESVQSASALPTTTDMNHSTLDQAYWYDIYQQARTSWNQIEQAYVQEIKSLQAQLAKTRIDSAFGFSSKENDKVYNDPDTVRHAQEKLRTLSTFSTDSTAASPLTEQTSAGGFPVMRSAEEVPMSEGVQQRHGSSVSRPPPLARISEDTVVTHTYDIPSPSGADGRDRTENKDDPLSPPTTTKLETPPNASLHAGHTPRVAGARSNRNSTNGAERPQFDGSDEDKALTGPLSLPSVSRDGEPVLAAMDQALQHAASSEKLSRPAIFQNDSPEDDVVASPHDETPGVNTSGDTEGIPLRLKRSTNFGLAFGRTS